MPGREQQSESRVRTELAPVYVNNERVNVRSANPTVAQVVLKAGHDPDRTQCYQLRGSNDRRGQRISMATVLHLAERREPIYLRCVPKAGEEGAVSVLPAVTTQPEDDPRRSLNVTDLDVPTPPDHAPPPGSPEPPGPPGMP